MWINCKSVRQACAEDLHGTEAEPASTLSAMQGLHSRTDVSCRVTNSAYL